MRLVLAVLKSFKRKRGFFLFPVISVAVGVLSVVIISSIGSVGKTVVKKEIETLGLNSLMISLNKISGTEYISQNELEIVKNCKTVYAAAPVIYQSSQIMSVGKTTDCLIWGVDGKSGEVMQLEIKYGKNISQTDIYNGNNVCLVDASYAKEHYGRENVVGKNIELELADGFKTFKIVGITDSSQSLVKNIISDFVPCMVYIPYTDLKQGFGECCFDSITVSVVPSVDSKQAEKEIENRLVGFSNIDGLYRIENLTVHAQTLENVIDLITVILSLIAGVSLMISGISVMTVMMFAVRERTHEIGIKKAIGASFFSVLLEFLIEAVVISLIGCLFGAVLGLTVCFVACKILNVAPVFDFKMIGVCIAVTALFGLVFGIYPAIKAARLDPAEALRRT